jgi:hypothetical protein
VVEQRNVSQKLVVGVICSVEKHTESKYEILNEPSGRTDRALGGRVAAWLLVHSEAQPRLPFISYFIEKKMARQEHHK